jgi:sugar phosphate isomerase/epimerase
MTMLLTLCAGSLASRVSGRQEPPPELLDLPRFAIRELQLHGLNLPASLLAGWSLEDLDKLRDRADRAACPCLVLVEDNSLPLGSPSPAVREQARERLARLAVAGNRLGCNAVALRCDMKDSDDVLDLAAEEIRAAMGRVERLELNVLITPGEGLTAIPDRLTDLIKRIGGFRIGSLPTFEHAAAHGDAVETLRKLAPYAGAVHATVRGFEQSGEHVGYDLAACVQAIRSVGFANTLAIDYVGKKGPLPKVMETLERAREALQAAIDADD